jgi:hypothetical protein
MTSRRLFPATVSRVTRLGSAGSRPGSESERNGDGGYDFGSRLSCSQMAKHLK